MQIKNEKIRHFWRSKGAYIFGGLFLAVLIVIAVIGKNSAGQMSIISRYANEKDKADSYEAKDKDSDITDYTAELYMEFLGIDTSGLRYPLNISGIDGECFNYLICFDRELPSDIVTQLSEQIERKCGKLADDNFYGYIDITPKPENKSVLVYLDLENCKDIKAINGICRAVNELEGVSAVFINSMIGSQRQENSDTYHYGSDELESIVDDINNSFQTHFDKLGTYYPIEYKNIDVKYNIILTFKTDVSNDILSLIKNTLDDKIKTSGASEYSINIGANDIRTVVIYCNISDIVLNLSQDLFELPDALFKLLDRNITGIEKAVIDNDIRR